MKYKLILFDSDETLFDYKRCAREAFSITLSYFQIPFLRPTYFEEFDSINMELWSDFESGKISRSILYIERFKRFFALDNIGVNIKYFNAHYLDIIGQFSYLIEEANDVCKALKQHCTIVILTNGFSHIHHRRVKNSPLSLLIDKVIATQDYGYAKPDKRIFDVVFELYPESDRDSILMVGDGLHSDVLGGINANIDTCWFNPYCKQNTLAVSPTYIISTLMELVPIVLIC
ncbi:YjjG family noncanonical pyrimidine nucleotidase [Scytonema sp. NUACC26]|uniref:YjjG family noncanonical pyrimidine nucleotidase n=1 Tax=Scytonema sp. NUACC26 TaxID=3140176 RepID=UPI0034DB9D97